MLTAFFVFQCVLVEEKEGGAGSGIGVGHSSQIKQRGTPAWAVLAIKASCGEGVCVCVVCASHMPKKDQPTAQVKSQNRRELFGGNFFGEVKTFLFFSILA